MFTSVSKTSKKNMPNPDVYPVILSGGSGTRLWPLSRKHYPKQFLKLSGDHSMIQDTALRVSDYNNPIFVCNESHRFVLAEQLREIDLLPSAILLEPCARNTAPALSLAAFEALSKNKDAILVVLASDHVITDSKAFEVAVQKGIAAAQEGAIVTFGIHPTRAETGFGYIKAEHKSELSPIQEFVEKPDKHTAESFLERGGYFWNSGIFVLRADTFLSELKTFHTSMYEIVQSAHKNAKKDLDFIRVSAEKFAKAPSDSIDYAVMEKTTKGLVLPVSIGWSDLGSFTTLWESREKDASGNVSFGDIINIDSNNSFVQSESQFVATVGVSDLVIVSTKDSLLVAHKDKVQDVKKVVNLLADEGRSEHIEHQQVHRPWGKFESINTGERYQVKRISVKPGASISKQMHHHRSEHWVVVKGTALVEIDGNEQILSENESVYIPLGATHRLTNPGKMMLEIVEVQSGGYLGEDDIVRFEDIYNR